MTTNKVSQEGICQPPLLFVKGHKAGTWFASSLRSDLESIKRSLVASQILSNITFYLIGQTKPTVIPNLVKQEISESVLKQNISKSFQLPDSKSRQVVQTDVSRGLRNDN